MADATPRRATAWGVLGWALAVGLVVGWIALFHAPGTLPWLFIAATGVGAVVLFTGVWSARPRGGARP
jgi:hypothetical protein